MRKSLMIMASGAMLLVLSACGEETTSEDGMSIDEVLNESIEAMESIESYSMVMDMNQIMDMGEEGEMEIDSSSDMSLTMDPMTFVQNTSMDMGDMGMGEEMDMEYLSYFSEEEGFFVEDPMVGEWMKLPEDFMDEILAMSDMPLSPEDQLKPFQDHISDLSLEETDSSYIINLEGDGLDVAELIDQLGGIGAGGMDEMLEELMEGVEIDSLDYEITIDKDTFFQTEASINMVMTMDIMGQLITTDQHTHMTLSDFNEIDPVEIPEDVLDNATEMSEEELTGGGF